MEHTNKYVPNSKVRFRIVTADEERQSINDSDDDQTEEEKNFALSPKLHSCAKYNQSF